MHEALGSIPGIEKAKKKNKTNKQKKTHVKSSNEHGSSLYPQDQEF
jgi:hypothetical protein